MKDTILESLGWALLHLVWQGALVAAALALALRLLGPRASARYALACGALGLMLVLPAATGWRSFRTAAVSSHRTLPGEAPLARSPWTARGHAGASPPWRSMPPAASLWARSAALADGLRPWGVLAWGLGVAVSSLRLLAGWMHLRRRVREASSAPEAWHQRLEALARRLGVRRAVRLLQSATLEVPSTVGWLRPVVLLPVSTLTGLPARQLEMILAHELAHIRRHDFAVNVLQTLVETLLFYHPAVWWISHVIRVERENCCDDAAAGLTGNALSYARALTALEALRVLPAAGPALSALGGSLTERVRRLVVPPPPRCASHWAAGISVFALMSSLAAAAPLTIQVLPPQAPGLLLAEGPAAAPQAPVSAPAVSPSPEPAPAPAAQEQEDTPSKDPSALSPPKVPTPGPHPSKDPAHERARRPLVPSGPAAITEEDVKAFNASFGRSLSSEELSTLRLLDITPGQVETLKHLGFSNVRPDTVTAAQAVGATQADLRGFKEAGYTDLEKATGMHVLGITPETLAGLAGVGLTGLSADTLMGFQATGVTPAYIQELRAMGLEQLTPDELIRLRLNAEPDLLQRLKQSRKP
jgi:beta-lactamase regulating signal transducer with metallopeptidase domain